MDERYYFKLDDAIREHDFIIINSGGLLGYYDLGLLESVIGHVQKDLYYPSIEDKATFICYSINKNHCFVDEISDRQ